MDNYIRNVENMINKYNKDNNKSLYAMYGGRKLLVHFYLHDINVCTVALETVNHLGVEWIMDSMQSRRL